VKGLLLLVEGDWVAIGEAGDSLPASADGEAEEFR